MILFDSQQWTEEEALRQAVTMMTLLADPGFCDSPSMIRTGEKRLSRLLKAIREARKDND